MNKNKSTSDLSKTSYLDEKEEFSLLSALIMVITSLLCVLLAPIMIGSLFRVVQQYQFGIVFRFGRTNRRRMRRPGLTCINPFIDHLICIDLRTVTYDIPPQEILTSDSVTVSVDAVVYYRIVEPLMAVMNVADYNQSTRLLAQTTLRNILGTKKLAQVLSEREDISHRIQDILDKATDVWGIKVGQ